MVVHYDEYSKAKSAFLRKHDSNFRIDTSPMDSYGVYHKEYVCRDGAVWYEVMSPEYVTEIVEIKFARCKVEVKMLKTEFWSSDDAQSKYYYEQF